MPEKNLRKYAEKRRFDQTPEPKGGKSEEGKLHFVIQKHDASRLHYDFRLEMDGVLKSWAVPKGPSLDPAVKRLAMQVEDHPYDYKDFEGIIPTGNYGAGTVIVWDEGTYEPLDGTVGKDRTAMEKSLLAGLKSGDLKFRLFGKKVQGEFALVKTHSEKMAENAWLLIKHKDASVSKKDLSRLDKSVKSGMTIAQMEKTPDNTYGKTAGKAAAEQTRAAKTTPQKSAGLNRSNPAGKSSKRTTKRTPLPSDDGTEDEGADWRQRIRQLPDTLMPTQIKPMLATLVDAPIDDPDWNFEIKWDGYRAISYIDLAGGDLQKSTARADVHIKSRNQQDFEEIYYPIKASLQKWKHSMVLDGELVVVDKAGMPQFGALQNWRGEADGILLYYVFDLLWYEGKDLRGLPFLVRQSVLKSVLEDNKSPNIRLGYSVRGAGKNFLVSAAMLGLEGMVAKKRDSVYETGHRSKSWLKIKVEQRQEAIIIGYTVNKGTSKKFSALLLGVYKNGQLQYAGKVGTGFSDKEQAGLLKIFKPHIRKNSPLANVPDMDKPSRFRPHPPGSDATWLNPCLVGEVSYRERTVDGLFRHPSFKGLREDKDPKEVILEEQSHTGPLVNQTDHKMAPQKNAGKKAAERPSGPKSIGEKKTKDNRKKVLPPRADPGSENTLLNPTEHTQVKNIGGRQLQFTNLNKLYWKQGKIEKRALINYYYQVAPYMLPYLKGRPQSLNRFPDGITGENFYQKDVTGKVPDWVSLYLYHSEGDKTDKHFLVADGLASLLFMASLGCIEMNPWSSTAKKPDNPTWCIIDLDPDKNKKGQKAFEEVITAARTTRDVLNSLGIEGYPKTSGASGMHVYIPLGNKYSYEQSKTFARLIVSMVQEQLPGFTTLERSVAERQGKMYLDFLQNRPQATIAAPYSVRPKPGATVSMPLDWSEVKPGLKRDDFNINNALARVKDVGDLFRPVLAKGINLKKVLNQIE